MLPPKTLDETLRPHATPTQWQYYEKYTQVGSLRRVSKALDRSHSSVCQAIDNMLDAALKAGWVPLPDPPELVTKGKSTLYDESGNVKAVWDKTRTRGMDPEEAVHVPDPKKLVSVSTMTDQEGRVIVQWSREKPEDVEREWMWERFAEKLGETIRPVPATPLVETVLNDDLLAVYPVGDHHVGMLAWGPETGDDYDLKIAERRLQEAADRLINTCPPCGTALVAFLGDFFHYDSYDSVTPAHKNLLDSDGRMPKMIDVGLMLIEYVIQAALEKHEAVHVIFEKGNHDPSTAAVITVFLKRLYRNEPRVEVDDSPAYFHYFKFGKCLLGTHHGDKAKAAQLPGIMAHDRSVEWGETTHRLWMTGHVHHESRKEYPGCFVESFGVLAAADAYAANNGYRSSCQMKALVFHKDHGEVERHTVNPGMFR